MRGSARSPACFRRRFLVTAPRVSWGLVQGALTGCLQRTSLLPGAALGIRCVRGVLLYAATRVMLLYQQRRVPVSGHACDAPVLM